MAANTSYILNKKLNVKYDGSQKLVKIPMLFTPKTVSSATSNYQLENANLFKKTAQTTALGNPYDSTQYFDESSMNGYSLISSLNGVPYEFNTPSNGSYVYYLLKFALKDAATKNGVMSDNDTVADLLKKAFGFNLSITVRGEGAYDNLATSGVNIYIYNCTTSLWEVIGTNSASSISETSASMELNISNLTNYLSPNDGSVYISVRPIYSGDGTIASKLQLDTAQANGFLKGNEIPVASKMLGNSDHVSIESYAKTAEQVKPFNVEMISSLSNDGAGDIQFNFDNSTTKPGTITLKSGETLNDFPRSCKLLYYKSNEGTQNFRAWGVK